MKTLIKALLIAVAFFATSSVHAEDPGINLKKPSFFGGTYKFALNGFDSTTYWDAGGPQKGDKKFSYDFKGTTWLFANQENLEKFKANPEKYRPQYGNFCAYALSQGSLAPADPTVWKIVEGKLYLNYNKSVAETWSEDIPGYLELSDVNWDKELAK